MSLGARILGRLQGPTLDHMHDESRIALVEYVDANRGKPPDPVGLWYVAFRAGYQAGLRPRSIAEIEADAAFHCSNAGEADAHN